MDPLWHLVGFLFGVCPGSEHQELQVSALADSVELPQPASSALDWYASAEQPHGTLVSDALPHATRLPVTSRVQGMVLESTDWND